MQNTYTGHSARHDGLQGHSVGDLYPIIITHYGDGGSGVMLGSHEIRGVTHATARSIASDVKGVFNRQGFNGAVIRLHALNVSAVMNT